MVWIAVDNDCNLHYDISVAGISSQFHPLQAYLIDMPLEVFGAPVNRRLLDEFSGNHLEGFILSISSNDLAKLESSANFLEIVSKSNNNNILKAKLKPIKIPNSCYPINTDNDVGVATASDNANQLSSEIKCYHSNRFYDDGEQWYSLLESCTVCACNNRRVTCDAIKCPPLRCENSEQIQKQGDCCPTCFGKIILVIFVMQSFILFYATQEKQLKGSATPNPAAVNLENIFTKRDHHGILTYHLSDLILARFAPATLQHYLSRAPEHNVLHLTVVKRWHTDKIRKHVASDALM